MTTWAWLWVGSLYGRFLIKGSVKHLSRPEEFTCGSCSTDRWGENIWAASVHISACSLFAELGLCRFVEVSWLRTAGKYYNPVFYISCMDSMVAKWFALLPHRRRSWVWTLTVPSLFCVEFVCPHHVCVGFSRVLQFPPLTPFVLIPRHWQKELESVPGRCTATAQCS